MTSKKLEQITEEMGDIGLFKYRVVNKYLLDSLKNSQLHFALPSDLNDPYDCQLDLTRAIRRASARVKGKQLQRLRNLLTDGKLLQTIQGLASSTAVCSFSRSLLNSALWSHYANDHRGVSVMYQFPQEFIRSGTDGIVGYSEVQYAESALTDWLVDNPVEFNEDYYVEIVKQILTIKGSIWAYEEEARVLRDQAGQLDLNREYLKQICFGLRTSKEDIELISKIIEAKYENVNLCEVVPGDTDFGLAAVDL